MSRVAKERGNRTDDYSDDLRDGSPKHAWHVFWNPSADRFESGNFKKDHPEFSELTMSHLNAKYRQLNPVDCKTGDAPGTRTPNLVIKSHLLCQLS